MELRYLKNVVSLTLNKDKCIGCGMCIEVCPHAVFRIKGKKAEIVDKDSCMECGACTMNCPGNAIHVNSGVGCAAAVYGSMISKNPITCECSGEK
jgi:NAD-dependent dihydropyrimidine dehydrogenase PreA subunit